MIPGQILAKAGMIELNAGRRTVTLLVNNAGDRPVQVGSHFHFFEVNRTLRFNRTEAYGMRLNIPAGTAIRFEPGEEKPVELTELSGTKESFGLNGISNGSVSGKRSKSVAKRLAEWQALGE